MKRRLKSAPLSDRRNPSTVSLTPLLGGTPANTREGSGVPVMAVCSKLHRHNPTPDMRHLYWVISYKRGLRFMCA